ncbi:branched-chain amino acid transport system II carrier protein [Clostridium baratii]|uniref:branched-chain amino acid transport system II carrier protein n=1 Tax=Clostridium baratii TaxID=1561 RepID=UPI0006BB2386|nr:branched-chain amino acid transport system II carrier protein [Clostridium baratii]
MKKKHDFIAVGFTIFAIFFGAGNLIFPPEIGINSGKDWFISLLGFFISGIGLPLLGILALNKAGTLEKFGEKIGSKFTNIYTALILICLGPIVAIPRTGASTYEMSILPNLGNIVSPGVFAVIFFGITLLLTLRPTRIVGYIGKVLTPIILVILSIIIVKGIFFTDHMFTQGTGNAFSYGFINGYQPMDALGAPLTAVIAINAIVALGYTKDSEKKSILKKASIVSSIGFVFVYGGLLFLGAALGGYFEQGISQTELTIGITHLILGNLGKVALGIAVAAACLTTAIGLTAMVGEFFSKLLKVKYEIIVTVICVSSAIISIAGIGSIIKLALPILMIFYPIQIILILFNIIGVNSRLTYKVTVYTTLVVSILDVLHTQFGVTGLNKLFNFVPLASVGFAWVVPAIIAVLVSLIINKFNKENIDASIDLLDAE